jgi:hypothetical protein
VSTFSDSLVTGGVFWHPMLIINRPQILSVLNNLFILFIASFLLDYFWYSESSLRNSHAKVGKTRRRTTKVFNLYGMLDLLRRGSQESQPRSPTGFGLRVQIGT